MNFKLSDFKRVWEIGNLWAIERNIGFTFSTLLASECVWYQLFGNNLFIVIFFIEHYGPVKKYTHALRAKRTVLNLFLNYLKCKHERCAIFHTAQEIFLSNSSSNSFILMVSKILEGKQCVAKLKKTVVWSVHLCYLE